MAITRNEPLRAIAERMYVEEGLTAKAIATALGKTEQTIGRWKKGIGKNALHWDDKRKNYLAAPHNIKKILMDELKSIAEGDEPSIDVKALASINKVIENLSDKVNTQVVYTVFKEFDSWMSEQDPELALKFIEFHKHFLLLKAQQEN